MNEPHARLSDDHLRPAAAEDATDPYQDPELDAEIDADAHALPDPYRGHAHEPQDLGDDSNA